MVLCSCAFWTATTICAAISREQLLIGAGNRRGRIEPIDSVPSSSSPASIGTLSALRSGSALRRRPPTISAKSSTITAARGRDARSRSAGAPRAGTTSTAGGSASEPTAARSSNRSVTRSRRRIEARDAVHRPDQTLQRPGQDVGQLERPGDPRRNLVDGLQLPDETPVLHRHAAALERAARAWRRAARRPTCAQRRTHPDRTTECSPPSRSGPTSR